MRGFLKVSICLWLMLFSVNAFSQLKKYVVAKDGTGDFDQIGKVIEVLPVFPSERIEIFIKDGIYKEKLVIPTWKTMVSFIGESKENTIITFDDYSGKGNINTFTSYTILVQGNDFTAENITFENSAGAFKDVDRLVGQAVALHVEADRAVFKNCNIIGDQDTFYSGLEGNRQFFKDCYIEGTTDFIFGPGTVVFENCTIHCKKNSFITAASTPENQPFGFVFLDCEVTADSGITEMYLGRPWRSYAKTVFINTFLGAHIKPEGWHNWDKAEAEKTVFYAENNSKGPGANVSDRVRWAKKISQKDLAGYTSQSILRGSDNWNIAGSLK